MLNRILVLWIGVDEFSANVIYGDYMPTFTVDEEKVREIHEREEKGSSVIFQ
jgi:hypothetical protein